MKTDHQDKIRESVRMTYGNIARGGGLSDGKEIPMAPGTNGALSCCGPSNRSAEDSAAGSCACLPTGVNAEQLSALMGYTHTDVKDVPEGANMGLGCGNPVALASLRPGETVVDLGSGGGFDCFLAARAVGGAGRVIGVDMTPDMLSKARKNAKKTGAVNIEFRLGEIENLPVADHTADIIMSNCVINLSPDKQTVYQEAFRVLKPGGRLAVSDVLATAELPDSIRNDLALVGACIGGAATIEGTKKMLRKAGFEDVRIDVTGHSRELIRKWDPEKSAEAADYVVSARIQAIRPALHRA